MRGCNSVPDGVRRASSSPAGTAWELFVRCGSRATACAARATTWVNAVASRLDESIGATAGAIPNPPRSRRLPEPVPLTAPSAPSQRGRVPAHPFATARLDTFATERAGPLTTGAGKSTVPTWERRARSRRSCSLSRSHRCSSAVERKRTRSEASRFPRQRRPIGRWGPNRTPRYRRPHRRNRPPHRRRVRQ